MLLTEAHADRPGYLGEANWEPDEFPDLVRTLHDDGWQVATHTCGDAAHDFVLDAYEAALAGADNDRHRHRIEHAFVIRDDQVERMRDLAVIASIQLPLMSADWAASVEAALGPERLAWAGRWRDLLEAGVPMVGGTDHPAGGISQETMGRSSAAMRALWDGATRTGVEAGAAPDWMTDQSLTVEQGLDLLTRAGAYATLRGGPEGHDHGREAGRPRAPERRPAGGPDRGPAGREGRHDHDRRPRGVRLALVQRIPSGLDIQ